MAIYPHLKSSGRFATTQTLAFSTIKRCRRDMANPQTAILHGFLQDKNSFVDKCVQELEPHEKEYHQPSKYVASIVNVSTRLNLRFFKRGKRAMLQALLLEQAELARSQAPPRSRATVELPSFHPEMLDYQVATLRKAA